MKTFLRWIATALAVILTAGALAVLALEWVSGCGESWVQADGSRVYGECIVIPHKPSQPTYHPPTSKP